MTHSEEIEDLNKIEQDYIIYRLNEKEKTAEIINNNFACGDVFIPRSIKHNNQEFIVTGILENSFEQTRIHSVQFSSDSEIRIIGKNAFKSSLLSNIIIPRHVTKICEGSFYGCGNLQQFEFHPESELETIEKKAFKYCSITSINIPSKVCKLEEGWMNSSIEKVTIDSKNKHFKNYEDKLILGKSDNKSDIFDVIVFAQGCIKTVTIPPYIKKIESYVFKMRTNLKIIEFTADSQLESIGKYAFQQIRATSLKLPSKVSELGKGWCNFTFYTQFIEKVTIDSNNKHFKNYGDKLILGKSDINSDIFDVIVFAQPNIETVTIPPCIKRIDPYAFANSSIKSIFIPSNVIEIGKGAFSFYANEFSIEFAPDSKLEVIEKDSFKAVSESIIIPPNVKIINIDAFSYSLKKMTVLPNNKHFKNYEDKLILGKSDINSDIFDVIVFAQRNIMSVTIPSNIKIIGPSAFRNSQIESIIIPSSVTKISVNAFGNCRKLKNVEISPDSKLEIIDNFAFAESNILSIFIPSHVEIIGRRAFDRCYSLNKVEFASDSNLQIIGISAFHCASIESIKIPSHTKIINDRAFSKCSKLKNFEFQPDSELRIFGESSLKYTIIESILIPSTLVMFGSLLFKNCEKIEQIIIQSDSNLRVIENCAFLNSSVKNLFIPKNVTKIYENAFAFSSLKNIEFSNNSELKVIEKDAFKGSLIESISLPSKLEELKDGWCHFAKLLKKVTIDSKNKNFKNYNDNLFLGKSDNKSDVFDVLYFVNKTIEKVEIPSSIKIIASFAFSHSQFKEIFIPSNVTEIKNGCFYESQLESIEFSPDSQINSIESEVFSYVNINEISIPRNVKKICRLSFIGCENLKSVNFTPDSNLQVIEKSAFKNSSIENLTFPSKLEKLEDGWCKGIEKVGKVTLMPNNKNFIKYGEDLILGKSDNKSDIFDVLVFALNSIEKVTIPSNIKKIASYAFSHCNVKMISLPSSVNHIGKSAFSNYNIDFFDIPHNSELQTIEKNAFADSFITSLYIPPHIKYLHGDELNNLNYIQIIEIDENSELELFIEPKFMSYDYILMCPKKISYLI